MIAARKVAKAIHQFINGADSEKDITLTNDCDDSNYDVRVQGYVWVGNRYDTVNDK